MAKYNLNPCNCDSCRRGEAVIVSIVEDGEIIFNVDVRNGNEMRIGFKDEWIYDGPIIRTEEDLFNAFAAMTQKRLKADTDG